MLTKSTSIPNTTSFWSGEHIITISGHVYVCGGAVISTFTGSLFFSCFLCISSFVTSHKDSDAEVSHMRIEPMPSHDRGWPNDCLMSDTQRLYPGGLAQVRSAAWNINISSASLLCSAQHRESFPVCSFVDSHFKPRNWKQQSTPHWAQMWNFAYSSVSPVRRVLCTGTNDRTALCISASPTHMGSKWYMLMYK